MTIIPSTIIPKHIPLIDDAFSTKAASKPAGKGDSLDNLTTDRREYQAVDEKRVTSPIDLTASKILEIGRESFISKLQSGVVRLRVEVNGQSLGCGSGIVISADGLILSVNHVPAMGQQAGTSNPFDFLAGSQALKNLKAWRTFTDGKAEARLMADFVQIPGDPSNETIFGSSSSVDKSTSHKHFLGSGAPPATLYDRDENTVDLRSYPVRILAESPEHDLMLCKVDIPETQDPFPFVKITDTALSAGDLVYSIGHPTGIKHNALALGEVLDPNFDVNKIKDAAHAHSVVLNGLANVLGGKGLGMGNMPADLAKGLSVALAGVDVETLINFMNGAVVSTNNIAGGSSGGLLTNKDGDAVGVTYLGVLMPYNGTALLRYAAGVLGFNARTLPLTHITGSVGVKTKAIPFLEGYGVNITRIRDGEPSGVADIERRVSRVKARTAMAEHLKASGVREADIPGKLQELGLGEEPKVEVNFTIPDSSQVETPYFIKQVDDSKVYLKAKPQEVVSFTPSLVDGEGGKKILSLNVELKLEGGETVNLEGIKVSSDFNPDIHIDSDTKAVLVKYFTWHPLEARSLNKLVGQAEVANSGSTSSAS